MGKKSLTVSQDVLKTGENKVGRKPLYTEWLSEEGLAQITKWAEEGLINKQLASKIGINVATLYEWQDRFPDFADAIKKGKKVIDDQVENSLLKRALGYRYEEETWGKNHLGEMVLIKRVVKLQAPDVTSQIFWLKNRQPERWRERVEIKNEHEGIKVEMGALEKWSN
ncbi:helix-turn-helix domain-containing protein [Psychrobacillus sp. FSL K6-2365]|uniref:helix-turn-helix domain-containing protein n=1 Tax=Psychrobacillus sp. FSL K6-2365 TaxID=2921546 RepID=UPI0030F4ECE4